MSVLAVSIGLLSALWMRFYDGNIKVTRNPSWFFASKVSKPHVWLLIFYPKTMENYLSIMLDTMDTVYIGGN